MKVLPILREIKRRANESAGEFKRRFPGPLSPLPDYGLSASQVYPVGRNLLESIRMGVIEQFGEFRLTPESRVASIGSCFAEEFAYFMMERGFNYLRSESDTFAASANWGRVYTVPNLRQVVEYSFDDGYPVIVEEAGKGWFDPLREHSTPFYREKAAAVAEIGAHRLRSKSVLRDADVLAVTLGQNEGWLDKNDGKIWARRPPTSLQERHPDRFVPLEFSFERNRDDLAKTLELLFERNTKLRIILTVSPVPAFATFSRPDVVASAFAAKCLLRTVAAGAASQFRGRVFYFPSLEIVLCDNPANFSHDNRHVRRNAVARIFHVLSSILSK